MLYVLIPPFDSRGLQRTEESHTRKAHSTLSSATYKLHSSRKPKQSVERFQSERCPKPTKKTKSKMTAPLHTRSKNPSSERYTSAVDRQAGRYPANFKGWLNPNQNVSHSTTRQLESCARESTANTKKQAPSVVPRFKPRGSSQGNALASCTYRRSIDQEARV